jgi:hypothetical protein
MIVENQMVESNGYGISDPQQEDVYYGVDACGTEILPEDVIIEIFGEVVLEENLSQYLMDFHGATKKQAE